MNPAWSLDNISFSNFPGTYLLQGHPYTINEDNISLKADSGAKYIYNLSQYRVLDLNFKFLESDKAEFNNFHLTVNGEVVAFFLSISGAGAADSLYGRKERGFDPVATGNIAHGEKIYEYTLHFEEEAVL